MKEQFTISIPTINISPNFWTKVLAIILTILLVLSVVTKVNLGTFAALIVAVILALTIVENMTGINYEGSLPPTSWPNPPHLGLDGVSLENRAAGRQIVS